MRAERLNFDPDKSGRTGGRGRGGRHARTESHAARVACRTGIHKNVYYLYTPVEIFLYLCDDDNTYTHPHVRLRVRQFFRNKNSNRSYRNARIRTKKKKNK